MKAYRLMSTILKPDCLKMFLERLLGPTMTDEAILAILRTEPFTKTNRFVVPSFVLLEQALKFTFIFKVLEALVPLVLQKL